MTTDALIMLAGGLVALMPFLGFPVSWDNVIFFLLGIFVVGLGIAVRRRFSRPGKKPELYAENSPASLRHDELAQ